MDQTPRVIKISEYSLDSFAVFDSDFYDITLLPLAATKNIVLQCDTSRDFTLDVSEDATRKTLDDGTAEEWNYAFMGTDNARLWTALVLEGRIRERTGSFAGWTVPMVIHGEAEDVETALTTASLMDLYATYKAMSALGAADQLQRYHGAPLITGE